MWKQCLLCKKKGAITFDYGNNIRQVAFDEGLKMHSISRFVPAFIRPLFCEGKGPFRWVALSGDPEDIYKTDEVILREFADNEHLCNWIRMARQQVEFKAFHHVFVGLVTVSVRNLVASLMKWLQMVNYQHQLLSVVTI